MPPEDRPVQVATIAHRTGVPDTYEGAPIEMGAIGEVVELLAVHYSLDVIGYPTNWRLGLGLSSNPEHLLNPPGSYEEFLVHNSIYGKMVLVWNWQGTGVVWREFFTQIIPLYGIIRPRRQVFTIAYEGVTSLLWCVAEIYYRPVDVDKVTKDLVNRKFGKYRRS